MAIFHCYVSSPEGNQRVISQSQCCFLLGTYRIIQGALGATRNLMVPRLTISRGWYNWTGYVASCTKKRRAKWKNHHFNRQNHQTQWVIFHSTYMIFILNYQSQFTISWKSTTTHPALNPLPNHASCFAVINHHHWWSRYLWGGYPNTSITMVLMVIKGAHPIWDLGMAWISESCGRQILRWYKAGSVTRKWTHLLLSTDFLPRTPFEPLKIRLSHLILLVGWKRFPNPMGPIIIPSKPGRIKSPFSQSIHQGILFMAHLVCYTLPGSGINKWTFNTSSAPSHDEVVDQAVFWTPRLKAVRCLW